MAHTYCSNVVHVVFSTKDRRQLILPELQPRLWSFIAGMVRRRGSAIAVGGAEDHVHILLALPATVTLASVVQQIKSGSSKWLHECGHARFEWQEGYGAFSVSVSHVNAAYEYIRNQKEHHKKRDFQAEFLSFLKKHAIDYDLRYVWG